jgi:hypothetical protein
MWFRWQVRQQGKQLNIYSFLLGEVGENPTLTRNRKSALGA